MVRETYFPKELAGRSPNKASSPYLDGETEGCPVSVVCDTRYEGVVAGRLPNVGCCDSLLGGAGQFNQDDGLGGLRPDNTVRPERRGVDLWREE